MTRCGTCSLPLSDDPTLWHSIYPRDDLPGAREANQWAQDHQGDYHPFCCPRCRPESDGHVVGGWVKLDGGGIDIASSDPKLILDMIADPDVNVRSAALIDWKENDDD